MLQLSLRKKILLSVSLIIFVVLGTSTLVNMQDLKRSYLEAITWRSEVLAQVIIDKVMEMYTVDGRAGITLAELSATCQKLYDVTKEKNVAHLAVISEANVIAAHNNQSLLNTPIENPGLLEQLRRREQGLVLVNSTSPTYHTLNPIFGQDNEYLGTIDIGVPKHIVDAKVQGVLVRSGALFGLFLILTIFSISLLMHVLLTKPVRHLVMVGQRLAAGNLVRTAKTTTGRGGEMNLLETAFNRISAYLQDIAEIASHVATGVLDREIHVRSEQDVLGKAIQEMLRYLKHIAGVAAKITEGDLTETVQVRSTADSFGQVIQTMTAGLRTLIEQIKTGVDQLALTKEYISAFASRDIEIVREVHKSMDHVVSTTDEIGTSVEEVAQNMETLSSSVQETSASVSQIAASTELIAADTTRLNQQTQQTIASMKETIRSLEAVVESTDMSKQLAQESIQDALDGQQAVEQVKSSMEMIQQTVMTAVEAITRFEQRSREIDTILDVIREITDQTSLLSLNASIIAAQAGAHGRGFAVVADEIRNLSNGVSVSTKDIAAIVKTLQEDTQQVVQTIHTGAEKVKQGMVHTQQARGTLQKIITSAQRSSSVVAEITEALHTLRTTSRNVSLALEQVNTMTDDITTATNEHQISTKQINRALEHINNMASQIQRATAEQLIGVRQVFDDMHNVSALIDQNLESSRQITLTAEELSSQAEMLLHSVDRFKLNG